MWIYSKDILIEYQSTVSMQVDVLVFVVLFPLFVSSEDKYYDRRYDYYDLDNLFQNPRLLTKYINCFLDKGPCTPVGRVFKCKFKLMYLKYSGVT